MGFGAGPGVKRVGIDTGRGKRSAPSNPNSGPATPGADGGVKNKGGRGSDGAYAQGGQARSGAPANTGAGGTAVGAGGGVRRMTNSGGR